MCLVELDKVTFNYSGNTQRKAFRLGPLNISLDRGCIVGIAGKNGVGKSTTLHLLSGLLRPASGTLKKEKEDLYFGICFQNAARSLLPWKTVADNINDFRAPSSHPILQQVMHSAAIPLSAYPYQLSGGQQQLVNLTRAFAMGRDVVLLDEPFSSLDYSNTLAVTNCLFTYRRFLSCAVVIVAHSLELQLALCQTVYILGDNPTRIIDKLKGVDDQGHESDFESQLRLANKIANEARANYDKFI